MARQLLQNRGFENELNGYIIHGAVTTNADTAYSGKKSAQLLASPTTLAEISQVVFSVSPGSPVRFSFCARRYVGDEVQSVSDIWAGVNFINAAGTVIPPGIVINIRGRDIGESVWSCYDGYGEVPPGTIAAQVVVHLEPPDLGRSGILVDDLALSAEAAAPELSQPAPATPVREEKSWFPGSPIDNPLFPVQDAPGGKKHEGHQGEGGLSVTGPEPPFPRPGR